MIRFIHLFLAFLALFAGNAQAVEIGRQIKLEAERPKPIVQPRFVQPSPEVLAALRFLTALIQARVRDAAGNETLSQVLSFTVEHSRDNLAPSFAKSTRIYIYLGSSIFSAFNASRHFLGASVG